MKQLIILFCVVLATRPVLAQLENNREHWVKPNETINSISEMYNVDLNKIIELNDLYDYDPDVPLIGEDAEYEIEVLIIPLSSVYYQFPFDMNVGGGVLDFSNKNWPGYYGYLNTLIQMPWAWEYEVNDNLYLWPVVRVCYNFNDFTEDDRSTIKQQGLSWQAAVGAKLQSVDYYVSAFVKYGQVGNDIMIASGFKNKYYYQSFGSEVEARIYSGRNKRDIFFSDVGFKLDAMFIIEKNKLEANWRYQPLSRNLLAHYVSLQGDFALVDLPIYHWLISLSPNMQLTWANFDSGSAQNYYSAGLDLRIYISGLQIAKLFSNYQFGQIERPLIGAEFNLGFILAKAAGY